MSKTTKTKLGCWLLAATLATMPTVAAADKIVIGDPGWPGAKIIAHVIKTVVTDKLGGEADLVPAKNPAIYAGMDAGKGGIDVHPDVWLPNQKSFTDEFVDKKKTVALSEGYYEGRTGFCIPTATAKEHSIRSVYDLATPEAQKVFDGDGDGEGEIWVGASGWASAKINQVKVRDYGIGDFLTPTTEDEAVFYAKMAAAVKDGEGVAFYCYSPHYVHKLHDVTMIEEPQHDKSKYVMVQPNEDPDWFTKSKITTGDQVKTVRVAYSRSLETRAPEIARFLRNINLDADAVSAMTHALSVEKIDPETVAAEWVKNNSATVDSWLGL